MSQYANLNQKLKNIFQIDRPDLDFGIYRILNARRREISDYLDNRLKTKVETYLADAKSDVHDSQLESITNQIKEEFGKRAFDDAGNLVSDAAMDSPLGEQYEQLREHSDSSFDQAQVFSHLYTFFSRYYDEGDFISQRRYKGDTYAIPYSGEEVMLHWANKDQYYTKSGEMFSNYRIRFNSIGEPDKSVLFRLLSADTAKDNQKDNDKNRRFVILSKPKTVTRTDEDGEEYEETVHPIELNDAGDELTVWFEYAVMDSKVRQDKLNTEAHDDILANNKVSAAWATLLKHPAPTEKPSDRDLLRKHLDTYTQKNTADYFIHKDLGKFLNNELDFYIKNEVMHLDNVVNSSGFMEIERQLALIKCLRKIGQELIDFLASLENFQKKLWLKKKFVVSSHYCITLDRVDEDLYDDIANNPEQWQQWEDLGLKVEDDSVSDWGKVAYLESHPYLMVDTSLYDTSFKAKLVNTINDLDEQTDGLIIHGDNFQALNLLQEKYQEKIQCVYIDPPYNAPNSEIAYKNNFKHSSFLSLIDSRLELSKNLINKTGAHVVAIDKHEVNGVNRLITEHFPNNNNTVVSVEHNRKGVMGDFFSYTNEYAIFSISEYRKGLNKVQRDPKDFEYSNFRNWGGESLRTDAANCFYAVYVKDSEVIGFGDVWFDESRHPEGANVQQADGSIAVYPIDSSGIERKWRYERGTVEGIINKLKVDIDKKTGVIQIKLAKTDDQFKTVWYGPKYNAGDNGTRLSKRNMGLDLSQFDYPKSVFNTKDAVYAVSDSDDIVLDYFAGSGTTAQSIITLNREQSLEDPNYLDRKYILVDQGEYFDTVLKPRIQKVIYSAEWKDGQPLLPKKIEDEANPYQGIGHCLKVIKLESYEDTLNNLELNRSQAQEDLFADLTPAQQDDYLMHYMLDIESKYSLLNVADFTNPFDYQLKITADSAGAYTVQNIDLIDTFNYLIGLKVRNIDYQLKQGYVQVVGHLRTGEFVTVFWRDCERIGYDKLNQLLDTLSINPNDKEYRYIYVNGDHNINSKLSKKDDGSSELKVRSIEQVFLERMFAE